jgi:hypothetical protein
MRGRVVRVLTTHAAAMGRFEVDLKSVYAPTIMDSMAPESGNR